MSFQRRWFLTAAGSAFLASISGMLQAGEKPSKKKPLKKGPADPDKDLLLKSFADGYAQCKDTDLPALTDDDKKMTCLPELEEIYGDRYAKFWNNLEPDQQAKVHEFAVVLGYISAQAILHEKKGDCGWDKKPVKKIGKEHIRNSREVLGFVLNSTLRVKVGEDKMCHKEKPKDVPKAKQIDEACPLCQP